MHLGRVEFNIVLLRTGRSLPAALHPCSRSRSCLQLRTDQCLCPIGTSTQLLVRTFRRTPQAPLGQIHPFDLLQIAKLQVRRDALLTVGKPSRLASGTPATQEVRRDALLTVGKPSRLASGHARSSRGKARRLTYCRQAVSACFGTRPQLKR
jgi:hypothetical protein